MLGGIPVDCCLLCQLISILDASIYLVLVIHEAHLLFVVFKLVLITGILFVLSVSYVVMPHDFLIFFMWWNWNPAICRIIFESRTHVTILMEFSFAILTLLINIKHDVPSVKNPNPGVGFLGLRCGLEVDL